MGIAFIYLSLPLYRVGTYTYTNIQHIQIFTDPYLGTLLTPDCSLDVGWWLLYPIKFTACSYVGASVVGILTAPFLFPGSALEQET